MEEDGKEKSKRWRRWRSREEDKLGTPPEQHVTEGSLPGAKIVQGCDRWVECGGVEWVSRCGVKWDGVEWYAWVI